MNTRPTLHVPRADTPARRASVAAAMVAALVMAVAGCGSAEKTTKAAGTGPSSSTADRSTTLAPPSSTTAATPSMRGQRYCEVLVVEPVDGNISADVYNSWPLNDCPADRWTKLDAKAIAASQGAPAALLNGPRFWLMDSVDKANKSALTKATFGDIEMYRVATVVLGPLTDAMTPYKPHSVDRRTVFTFDAGRTVYELRAPDGSTYVMQSWSQLTDPTLAEGDLAELGSRLNPPPGWTYSSRRLSAPLRIATLTGPAQVLQDELRNSYSLETSG